MKKPRRREIQTDRCSCRCRGTFCALESASEKGGENPLDQTLDWSKAEGNCVTEGNDELRPPKVGWRATGGEPVGPYGRNSIRPDVVASLRNSGEAPRPGGRRREKRPCGEESRTRNETSAKKADMERHRVVGDRTTGKFRWRESGITTARAERAVADRAFVRAEKRRNGRGAKGGREVNA
jgi:hypothetical protein